MKRFLNSQSSEFVRYVTNGVVATIVHYSVLSMNLEVLKISSAGIANVIAAVVGISISFLGSRYFVFRCVKKSMAGQAFKFVLLYGFIAVLHGMVLLIWSDWLRFDYRFGFLIATGVQFSLSYCSNKLLVFRI